MSIYKSELFSSLWASCLVVMRFHLTILAFAIPMVICAQGNSSQAKTDNFQRIADSLTTIAEQGNAEVQLLLALHYELGNPPDYEQAFYWYKKSAELDDFLAQSILAEMYYKGENIPKDMERAFFWFKRSAELGNTDAYDRLAKMYYDGLGTLTDKNQAFYWYKESAKEGSASAQFNLGLLYYKGEVTLVDKKQAFYWYKKSAEQGEPIAQFSLSLMYILGEAIPKDMKQAAYWMRKAYDNGYTEAKDIWEKFELWKYE